MTQPFEDLQAYARPIPPPRSPLALRGRTFVFLVALAVLFGFFLWQGVRTFAEPDVVPIGEEQEIYPFVYSVQSVQSSVSIGSGLLERRADGVYKTVTVTVRNANAKPHSVSEDIVSIVDAAGEEYYPLCRSDLGSCVELPQTFTERFVEPNEEVFGVFVFDVPARSTGFKLKILTDPFSGTFILFDLD